MLKTFQVYSEGSVYASVCSSLSLKETKKQMNDRPTGTKFIWKLAKETFRTGEANPHSCEDYPETHKHYLFVC